MNIIEGKQVSRPENLTTEDIIAQDWEIVGERRKG